MLCQKPGLRLASRVYSMLLAHEYKKYVNRHAAPLADRLKEVTRPWKSMLTLRELDENVSHAWRQTTLVRRDVSAARS